MNKKLTAALLTLCMVISSISFNPFVRGVQANPNYPPASWGQLVDFPDHDKYHLLTAAYSTAYTNGHLISQRPDGIRLYSEDDPNTILASNAMPAPTLCIIGTEKKAVINYIHHNSQPIRIELYDASGTTYLGVIGYHAASAGQGPGVDKVPIQNLYTWDGKFFNTQM